MAVQLLKPHPVEIAPPDISRWQSGANSPARFVQEFHAESSGPEVLISALVHGNEYAGAIVLSDLLHLLQSGVLKLSMGRITAVFANVDSFLRFDANAPDASRFIDQDFNRVWSEHVLQSSQRSVELDRAREILPFVQRATHVLDLHSMHEPCEPLLITGTLERNVAFAQSLGGVGQVVIDAGHQDGVRMRDYGDFSVAGSGKIALLLEAGQHWHKSSIIATRDVMLRFLLRTGVLTMHAIERAELQDWFVPDRPAPIPVKVTHAVVARSMNFSFSGHYTGNEVVARVGSVIAHDDGEPITTPYADCVLVMPSIRQLRPGVTTVRLGQRVT
jgi:predicted deacylase